MMPLLPLLVVFQAGVHAAGTEYQPLAVGDSWTYRVDLAGKKTQVVRKVTGKTRVGKLTAYTMVSELTGEKPDTALLYWSDDGLNQAESTSLRFTPPLIEVKLPLTARTEWAWVGSVRVRGTDYPAKAVCSVVAVGKVTVPAGKFLCTVVEKQVTFEAGLRVYKITSTDSYAKGVGWVKGVLKSGDLKTVTELVSYKLAK